MRALTTSELNQALINKGLENQKRNNLPVNKWGADYFTFFEGAYTGKSSLDLCIELRKDAGRRINSYNKMNSADKKEFANMILNLI